jgi:hypothetical protein
VVEAAYLQKGTWIQEPVDPFPGRQPAPGALLGDFRFAAHGQGPALPAGEFFQFIFKRH